MKDLGRMAGAVAVMVVLTALIEFEMGRTFLGPDGRFALWAGDIWSSEQSQRFADPYSFTHILHGMIFYALFWFAARKVPVRFRFLAAVFLEAAWEVLENSPFIINRYREATIALGYTGDSVLNSLSDILMMSLGFLIAWRLRVWVSAALVAITEIILILIIRDSLGLNVLMLVYPIEAIKNWQMRGQPLP